MPPLAIRQLRDLMRYRFKLTNFPSNEKNRLQNCLTVSNIQLGNVVSDTFGKSSMNIINKLLENPLDTSFDIESLIHGSMKSKLPELDLSLAEPYTEEVNLILTVPSFKNIFFAIAVISEIDVNMDVFPTAKHLCSWAGLTPINNESAGKKKSVRISRAGCYIKPLLVQCATAVVKSEKHPEIRTRYLKLKNVVVTNEQLLLFLECY